MRNDRVMLLLFQISLAAFALAALAGAVLFPILCRDEQRLSVWEKVPRWKKPGAVLAVIVILWCIPNLRPILDPNSFLQPLLYPLAIVAAILCIVYLDYLFSRAFAGFLILLAHFLLKEAFAANVYPVSAVFALLLMMMGVIGIVISAKPYYLRDWIRFLFRKKAVRYGTCGYLAVLALSAVAMLIATLV